GRFYQRTTINDQLFSHHHGILQNKIAVLNVTLIQFEDSLHMDKFIHFKFSLFYFKSHFGYRLRAGTAAKETLTVWKLGKDNVGIILNFYREVISLQCNFPSNEVFQFLRKHRV